jgi:hypothetical protein
MYMYKPNMYRLGLHCLEFKATLICEDRYYAGKIIVFDQNVGEVVLSHPTEATTKRPDFVT